MATDWTDDSARDWNKDDPSREEMLGRPLKQKEVEHLKQMFPVYTSLVKQAEDAINSKIYGQKPLVRNIITSTVAGGNTRLVGDPGLAKTELVQVLTQVLNLLFIKIQFTADMMPSDITGSNVYIKGKDSFEFKKGPVFTQQLFADEINRAGAKVQSALLEAMQSGGVTIDGVFYPVPNPFMVIAAQNPDGQAGTTPLTEAQLDRFMQDFLVDYVDAVSEARIMVETTGPRHDMLDLHRRAKAGDDLTEPFNRNSRMEPVFSRNDIILMQNDARHLYLPESVVDATIHIVRKLRPNASEYMNEHVEWGPGPRAYQAFALVAKARALMRGEMAPNVGDILAIAKSVLEHRMRIKHGAQDENGKPITFETLFNKVAEPWLLDKRHDASGQVIAPEQNGGWKNRLRNLIR